MIGKNFISFFFLWALIIITNLFHNSLLSQSGILQGGGAMKVSMAYINTSATGIDAVFSNPAGMVLGEHKMSIDLGVERRFGLDELSTYSGGFLYKKRNNAFAVSIVKYGFEDYSEQKLALGYARNLFTHLSIGANFNAISYDINQFGNKTLLTVDVGLHSKINRQLSLAFQMNNPIVVSLNELNDLPSRMAFACVYTPSLKISTIFEFEKVIDRDIAAKVGLQYTLIQQLQVRLGYDITRSLVGIGFSLGFSDFKVAGAMSYNSFLGNTPAINIQYSR